MSKSENKIVVSPSHWFNNDYESPLIAKDWILKMHTYERKEAHEKRKN